MQKILTHNRNHKVGKNTLIFNLTSAMDCPSDKLGLCSHSKECYAKKSERQYAHCVLPYRRRQEKQFDRLNATQLAKGIIDKVSRMKVKIEYLRLNESGDFRSQKDVEKVDTIARYLLDKGIRTYCYTSRKDLDFKGTCFCVNGSGFMLCNNFYVVDKYSDKDKVRCKGSCATCNLCKIAKGLRIAIEKH